MTTRDYRTLAVPTFAESLLAELLGEFPRPRRPQVTARRPAMAPTGCAASFEQSGRELQPREAAIERARQAEFDRMKTILGGNANLARFAVSIKAQIKT